MKALDVPLRDLAAVEKVVRASGTSFYRGMKVLPPDRRAAMYAIYAFCRLVDDIADEPAEADQKAAALNGWRARITDIYRGVAEDAVSRVLMASVHRFGLREADFAAIIDGMQMDAERVIVAPSVGDLDLYCDRVAAAVGRLSVCAFGDASDDAQAVAWALGRALQYTNILRDLAEDAARGRLYLPREWLIDAGVPCDPSGAMSSPRLAEVCERMAQGANMYFLQATAMMKLCDRRAMRPARLMAAGYRAVLDGLIRRGWQRLDQRPRVSRLRQLRILAVSLWPGGG